MFRLLAIVFLISGIFLFFATYCTKLEEDDLEEEMTDNEYREKPKIHFIKPKEGI